MRELLDALGPDAPGGGALKVVSGWAAKVGIGGDELPGKARELAAAAAAKAAVGASVILGITANVLLGLLFMMLAMHFVLRNASLVVRIAIDTLPLKPEWTASLAAEFKRVGRATLLGTIVTALAQGLLATLGFWIGGVPDPIFYGAVTALASLVPAIGTLLIWVPVGLVMLFSDHVAGGAFALAWGALVVVGVSDYLIRPRLVGADAGLPPLLTFAALFGGVEVLGLRGLIVGPLIISLAIAVLRIYSTEIRRERETGSRQAAT
jgi:predicted PurR-regulated permease PerM